MVFWGKTNISTLSYPKNTSPIVPPTWRFVLYRGLLILLTDTCEFIKIQKPACNSWKMVNFFIFMLPFPFIFIACNSCKYLNLLCISIQIGIAKLTLSVLQVLIFIFLVSYDNFYLFSSCILLFVSYLHVWCRFILPLK